MLAPLPSPCVEVLSAHKTYANGTQALAPVSLTVQAGEFVSLIGPSGCGKSTLLKMIAGLLTPTDGRIRWWRSDLDAVGQDGHTLAFVFQEATLMPWSRVAANVRLPLDLAGVAASDSAPRVQAALERVGLGHHARHYPRELSGGMQMRVSIARALVTAPDLLLMDEPFGALDEITRNRLDEDMRALCTERNLTVVFVTHSVYEAAFLSDRVVVMAARPGRVHASYDIAHTGPRDATYRASDTFARHCADLSGLLYQASLASGSDQGPEAAVPDPRSAA
jgi:NitT/TauT family transport system ATP-binding protein